MRTTSEENYIKAIFKLSYELKVEVTTGRIAETLSTKASSATDMMQKLAAKGLVNYTKYQGVSLTSKGEKIALDIIRKHRIWEVFLFQVLQFKWNEVHQIAEELEHIKSKLLVERLDEYLNYPQKDPHGLPIPDSKGNFSTQNMIPLSEYTKEKVGIVGAVNEESSAFLSYLDKMGIELGTELEVNDWNEFDNSFDIKLNGNKLIHLSYQVVQNILMIEK